MDEKINIVKETLNYFEHKEGELIKLSEFNKVLRSVMKNMGAKYKMEELDLCLALINPLYSPITKYITGKCCRYVQNLSFKGI